MGVQDHDGEPEARGAGVAGAVAADHADDAGGCAGELLRAPGRVPGARRLPDVRHPDAVHDRAVQAAGASAGGGESGGLAKGARRGDDDAREPATGGGAHPEPPPVHGGVPRDRGVHHQPRHAAAKEDERHDRRVSREPESLRGAGAHRPGLHAFLVQVDRAVVRIPRRMLPRARVAVRRERVRRAGPRVVPQRVRHPPDDHKVRHEHDEVLYGEVDDARGDVRHHGRSVRAQVPDAALSRRHRRDEKLRRHAVLFQRRLLRGRAAPQPVGALVPALHDGRAANGAGP